MRLEKVCACGASIVAVYDSPKSEYDRSKGVERRDALDQLKAWDRAHKGHERPAPSDESTPASPAASAPQERS